MIDVAWILVCLSFLYCVIRRWAERRRPSTHIMIPRVRPKDEIRVSIVLLNSIVHKFISSELEQQLNASIELSELSRDEDVIASLRSCHGAFVMVIDAMLGIPDLRKVAIGLQHATLKNVWACPRLNFVLMSRELSAVVDSNLRLRERMLAFEAVMIAKCLHCSIEWIGVKWSGFNDIGLRFLVFLAYWIGFWEIQPPIKEWV